MDSKLAENNLKTESIADLLATATYHSNMPSDHSVYKMN